VEIAARIADELLTFLDAPVEFDERAEQFAAPQVEDLSPQTMEKAVAELMKY